jgi:succinylarginine dihydrolase
MRLIEIQVDRIVGPTHHFGGLGVGNVASTRHAGEVSNPAAAALEGLGKMRLIARLGVEQMILPPQQRPDYALLDSVGFPGHDTGSLVDALDQAPSILSAAMSCSAMWTANAATVCPAIDARQGHLSITIANLNASLHRAIESQGTERELRNLFGSVARVRTAMAGGSALRDEGAANHMRLGSPDNQAGIHLFVYGDGQPTPHTYWPRQTFAASQAVARNLQLDPSQVFFLKQHPRAIDAGAFHNDVVAASHHNLLLYHESAYQDLGQLDRVALAYRKACDRELVRVEVSENQLPLDSAIATYLFNSQIVSPADPSAAPVLICPSQVQTDARASRLVASWRNERQIFSEVHFVELGQSMSGGGGPACLRLRVPVTEDQLDLVPARARWSEALDELLREVIETHYPTRLTLPDLASEDVVREAHQAQRLICELLNVE